LYREGISNERAYLPDASEFSAGVKLHQNIPNGCGFRWSREYRSANGICGEAVEQMIACSASDDVQRTHACTHQVIKTLNHESILESETGENAADDGAFGFGRFLSGALAE
jgi:hypothetical protein